MILQESNPMLHSLQGSNQRSSMTLSTCSWAVVDPDIRLGGTNLCFPVSHIYFFVGGGQSLSPNWMEDMAGYSHLGPLLFMGWIHSMTALMLTAHCFHFFWLARWQICFYLEIRRLSIKLDLRQQCVGSVYDFFLSLG